MKVWVGVVSFIKVSLESDSSGALSQIFAIFALVLFRIGSIILLVKTFIKCIDCWWGTCACSGWAWFSNQNIRSSLASSVIDRVLTRKFIHCIRTVFIPFWSTLDSFQFLWKCHLGVISFAKCGANGMDIALVCWNLFWSFRLDMPVIRITTATIFIIINFQFRCIIDVTSVETSEKEEFESINLSYSQKQKVMVFKLFACPRQIFWSLLIFKNLNWINVPKMLPYLWELSSKTQPVQISLQVELHLVALSMEKFSLNSRAINSILHPSSCWSR